jgi:hypothetical protein
VDAQIGNWFATAIQGQLLRWSARREVAIYLRDDALWIADFIDGDGALIDAVTWLRFNCATAQSSWARRRMILESAFPLSTELAARIEGLHRVARTAMGRDGTAQRHCQADDAILSTPAGR